MLAHYTDTQTKIAKRSEWNPKEKTQKIFLNFRSFLISKLLSFPIIFQLIEVKFVCVCMSQNGVLRDNLFCNTCKPNQTKSNHTKPKTIHGMCLYVCECFIYRCEWS